MQRHADFSSRPCALRAEGRHREAVETLERGLGVARSAAARGIPPETRGTAAALPGRRGPRRTCRGVQSNARPKTIPRVGAIQRGPELRAACPPSPS